MMRWFGHPLDRKKKMVRLVLPLGVAEPPPKDKTEKTKSGGFDPGVAEPFGHPKGKTEKTKFGGFGPWGWLKGQNQS